MPNGHNISEVDDNLMELSELRFSSISPSDSGTYECRVSNGVEEDLVTRIKLTVKGK